MLIEFTKKQTEVLLSDFDTWHYVLNYWHFPYSLKEEKEFDKKLKNAGLDYYSFQLPLRNMEFHKRIEKSWENIFDLHWYNKRYNYPFKNKSIQATFWELSLDEVKSMKYFRSR